MHLKSFIEMKCSLCIDGRGCLIGNLAVPLPYLRIVGDDADIDNHVVLKVLVPRNKCIATVILKADAFCRTLVKAVEILDGGHNGFCVVMGKYLHPHRQPCSMIGSSFEQQLEGDIFGRRVGWGNAIGCLGIVAKILVDRRGGDTLIFKSHVV